MTLASTLRSPAALALAALLLAAPSAEAEPVTHRFTGQLTTITSGGSFLDLRSVFTMGQAASFEYTIERNTPAVDQDPYTDSYTDGIPELTVTIGGWSGTGTPGFSYVTVSDEAPSPGNPAVTYDQYSGQVQGGIVAPPLGTVELQSLTWTLDDVEGSVFASKAIPRVFPDLGVFEGKTLTVLFFDFTQFKSGYVMATLAGVTTPAQLTTWGGVKALYR